MDDINELGSHELKPLDPMNRLELQVISTIPCSEEKAPNVMNNSGVWMT